jgi:hypothetical protein
MKPKKISLLSIVIVALLSTGYSSITPAAENLCDITDAPDSDLSTLADDLQKRIDKLTELQKSWKEDNAQFIKAANADEASLILLKVATTLKAASSSILAVGGLIGGGAVAASPALLVTAAISNTVGVFNDEANATNKEDLLVKYNVDNIILAQEYKTAIGIAEESKFVSAWSKLSTWSGVVADNMEAIKTLATKSTLRSKLNSMNNQYNKFLNNDIATLKASLAKVKKAIDKTDKKLGKDVLDLIKKTKKNTVESCQELNPEPIPEPIIPNKPPIITEPIITEPKGIGFTKIANNGSTLPDSAVLGTASTDWACTKDNATGLIWEVKTNDGGLRDQTKTYTNYDAIYPKCDDSGEGWCKLGKLGDSTNTDGFVKAVNAQGLCGSSNWRLPTKDELLTISPSGYGTGYFDYFYGYGYRFWSSSPTAYGSSLASDVYFENGFSGRGSKNHGGFVRLVR